MADSNRTTTTPRPSQGAPTNPGRALDENIERRRFVTVIRGYDRIEVDEYIDDLLAVISTLRTSIGDAERVRRSLEERLAAADRRAAEKAEAPPVPSEGFGMRAERLLRMAENEAAEIRAAAATESSAIVERARADAEQRRHEAEQALIARAAQVDEEAGRRTAALDEREAALKAQAEASRSEIEQINETAKREADQLRQDARREIDAIRAAAAQDAARAAEAVRKDVDRLVAVRDTTRQELARIVELASAAAAAAEEDEDGEKS